MARTAAETQVKGIRLGLIAVAACGLLLAIVGSAVVFALSRTDDLSERQEFVSAQLSAARRVFETVAVMESSQRGYLLTREPAYLEPYRRGSGEIDAAIADLERLFHGDPAAGDVVAEIASLARAKAAELAESVEIARAGNFDIALAIVRSNRSAQDMLVLHDKLLSLIARQRTTRTAFVDQAHTMFRRLYLLGAGAAVLMVALVVVAMRALAVSIGQLDAAQKTEERNAMHDALTGLPNRRYLNEWLDAALAGARRAARPLHVLYFDLDGFKSINDRFGHEAGDRALQSVAQRLREAVRASDFIARLGGDEFVAVLSDTVGAGGIPAVIGRIEESLHAALIPELIDGEISASIGDAAFPRDGDTTGALLGAADTTMYDAKLRRRAGRAATAAAVAGE